MRLMMSKRPYPSTTGAHARRTRLGDDLGVGLSAPPWWQREAAAWAPQVLAGVALVLLGAVAGLAAGQALAQRSAHRTGACNALNMAAALGYLDTEQQRRVQHALATAANPEADLFSGGRHSLPEPCSTGAGPR